MPPTTRFNWRQCSSRCLRPRALRLRRTCADDAESRSDRDGPDGRGQVRSGHRVLALDYLPRTRSIPESSNVSFECGSLLTRSVSRCLSIVTTWDTLATESFGSPVRRADKRRFPGANAHLRLLVNGTQITVPMRLRFKASHWTTTTGLRNPGPEPVGAGRSAHQSSPCEITTRFALGCDGKRMTQKSLPFRRLRPTPGSLSR